MSHAGPNMGTQIVSHSDGFTQQDRAMLSSLHRHITGGSNWEDGILNRTDRLEQAQKQAAWWARTALGAAIGAVVVGFWGLLTGKHQ